MSTSTAKTSTASRPSKFPLNLFKCCISQNFDDNDIQGFLHQDKNVECNQSHTTFNDSKQLKKHRKIKLYCDAFSNEVNVKCTKCHNIFRNNKELNNHRK